MPIEKFIQHPALKPTVLVGDILENVYRPTQGEMDGDKTASPVVSQTPTRERHRAA
jgi:hypothetical protein